MELVKCCGQSDQKAQPTNVLKERTVGSFLIRRHLLKLEDASLASNEVFGRVCSGVFQHKNATCLPLFCCDQHCQRPDTDTDGPLGSFKTV